VLGRAAFLVLLLVAAPRASAQACPLIEGGDAALAERTTAERADFLLAETRRGEEAARTWTAIFALSYLAIAIGQTAALTATQDPGTRIELGVGAVSSLIGVASFFVLPRAVLADLERMEALAPRARTGDCEALEAAEQLFLRDAASEAFGTSWLTHVGSVLFNLGVGLFLGLVYDRWVAGAISAGVGILTGELQILTQPTPMVAALARYRAGELGESAPPPLTIAPAWDGTFAGVTIGGAL
jgi:hypothetical protein